MQSIENYNKHIHDYHTCYKNYLVSQVFQVQICEWDEKLQLYLKKTALPMHFPTNVDPEREMIAIWSYFKGYKQIEASK